MSTPYDFTRARKELVAAVGKDTIVALHRPSPWKDWLGLVVQFGVFTGLALLLGDRSLRYTPVWWVAFFLQGFVILAFGYMMHDLFMHRRVGGRTVSYILGNVTAFLSFLRFTEYRHTHGDHHKFTGTDEDEVYKQDLDTRWKRVLFCTPVGYLLAVHRLLKTKHPAVHPSPEGSFRVKKPDRTRHWSECMVQLALLVLIVMVGIRYPEVRYGYVMPLLFALPLANVLRIILEHAETNDRNTYHCATYYRTGLVTRPLFFWDAGDCHLVHHIFPAIPFYNMGRACDVLREHLLKHGVRERRSLLELCWGYFVKCQPHRALWAS